MATARPMENPREIVTQFGKSTTSNLIKDYRYLRLGWTDDVEQEYILCYNMSRNGFWLSSAPHERNYSLTFHFQWFLRLYFPIYLYYIYCTSISAAHFGEQPSFGAFSGTIQVIALKENYLLLTFCVNVPQQQLFSIILTRHPNSLSMDVSKNTYTEKLIKIIKATEILCQQLNCR